MNLCGLVLFALAFVVVASEKFSYTGYQLFQLTPKDELHHKLIAEMENKDIEFDIWKVHRNSGHVDVLLPPSLIQKYTQLFDDLGIEYIVLESNIQNKIDEQERSMIRTKDSKNIIFKYARYSEIMNFVDETVNANSDIASSYIAGTTVENRQLKVIKIKVPNTSTSKAVWIDCGIHAREWVTPATCVYIIDQLIKEYRANEAGNVLSKYEVHIMPLHNADGYEYSHTTYRLWRKNRSLNAASSCIGTDLNRNYVYGWMTGGSSSNPCSDTYAGKAADSENETKAVQAAINAKAGQWDAFLNIHSYGNWWLTPYGNSYIVRPSNYDDMMAKGKIGAAAIKAYKNQGQIFTVGTSADLLYINSGSSKDWARGTANIPYSYVLELRPGDRQADSQYGFTLPEDRMPLVAPETFAGIKAFLNAI
jgi:hypothetical protein